MKSREVTRFKPGLLFLGGITALLSELVFRPNYSAEFHIFNGFGIFDYPEIVPGTAQEWFVIFQKTPVVGLVLLDGADLIHYVLVAVIFLALFSTIKFQKPWINWFVLGLGLSGVVIFLVGNQAFMFYSLSQKYPLVDASRQAEILVQAERILSIYDPLIFGWMDAGKFLIMLAGLFFSIGMFKDELMPGIIGIFGLLSNGIGLLYYPVIWWFSELYALPTPISAPFRLVWHVLLGIYLIMLSQRSKNG